MGRTMNEKLHNAYVELQVRANCLYDSESAWGNKEVAPGIKQLLEKKQVCVSRILVPASWFR